MDKQSALWLVLVVAVLGANWPYLSNRILFFGPARPHKALAWRLLELSLMAILTLMIGFALESRIGQRHAQGWEFYGAGLCLFITLGFPGFVWRYLRRPRYER